jgi:hypothetical protein
MQKYQDSLSSRKKIDHHHEREEEQIQERKSFNYAKFMQDTHHDRRAEELKDDANEEILIEDGD